MSYVHNDGGRAEAGYSTANDARDCVVRAIAIATERSYQQVYDEIGYLKAEAGGKCSGRDGVSTKVIRHYFEIIGWEWIPTMKIGSGCTTHLRSDELPPGRIVVRASKHLCAVVDGVVHDTTDPSRDGTRCVYGYWKAPDGVPCKA